MAPNTAAGRHFWTPSQRHIIHVAMSEHNLSREELEAVCKQAMGLEFIDFDLLKGKRLRDEWGSRFQITRSRQWQDEIDPTVLTWTQHLEREYARSRVLAAMAATGVSSHGKGPFVNRDSYKDVRKPGAPAQLSKGAFAHAFPSAAAHTMANTPPPFARPLSTLPTASVSPRKATASSRPPAAQRNMELKRKPEAPPAATNDTERPRPTKRSRKAATAQESTILADASVRNHHLDSFASDVAITAGEMNEDTSPGRRYMTTQDLGPQQSSRDATSPSRSSTVCNTSASLLSDAALRDQREARDAEERSKTNPSETILAYWRKRDDVEDEYRSTFTEQGENEEESLRNETTDGKPSWREQLADEMRNIDRMIELARNVLEDGDSESEWL